MNANTNTNVNNYENNECVICKEYSGLTVYKICRCNSCYICGPCLRNMSTIPIIQCPLCRQYLNILPNYFFWYNVKVSLLYFMWHILYILIIILLPNIYYQCKYYQYLDFNENIKKYLNNTSDNIIYYFTEKNIFFLVINIYHILVIPSILIIWNYIMGVNYSGINTPRYHLSNNSIMGNIYLLIYGTCNLLFFIIDGINNIGIKSVKYYIIQLLGINTAILLLTMTIIIFKLYQFKFINIQSEFKYIPKYNILSIFNNPTNNNPTNNSNESQQLFTLVNRNVDVDIDVETNDTFREVDSINYPTYPEFREPDLMVTR